MTPDETRAALQAALDAIDKKEAENAALNLELARAQAATRDAEAQAADAAAAHDEALKIIAANEESRRIPATVPAGPPPVVPPKVVAPSPPAAPSKPSAPLGRNGRPIISRHCVAFLLAALLGLASLAGCGALAALPPVQVCVTYKGKSFCAQKVNGAWKFDAVLSPAEQAEVVKHLEGN